VLAEGAKFTLSNSPFKVLSLSHSIPTCNHFSSKTSSSCAVAISTDEGAEFHFCLFLRLQLHFFIFVSVCGCGCGCIIISGSSNSCGHNGHQKPHGQCPVPQVVTKVTCINKPLQGER